MNAYKIMRKHVLYIDYMSPKGHIGFNLAQINSFCKLDCKLHYVFREGYRKDLHIDNSHITEIPDCFYSSGRIASRWSYVRILRFIRKQTECQHWDMVIFSSYDTVSLALCRIYKGAYIFNHNNLQDLDNLLKRLCFLHVSRCYKQVVFNELARQKLLQYHIVNTVVIPHGFVPIPAISECDILTRYSLDRQRYIIFPGNGAAATRLTSQIAEHPMLVDYCAGHGFKIVVRTVGVHNPSCISITDYLSVDEYYTLLKNSFVSILCYDTSFKYRVSGILFECMALSVPAVTYQNDALKEYSKYSTLGRLTFSNPKELCDMLDMIAGIERLNYYKDLAEIAEASLAWSNILKNK